jgi:hypothetical protein
MGRTPLISSTLLGESDSTLLLRLQKLSQIRAHAFTTLTEPADKGLKHQVEHPAFKPITPAHINKVDSSFQPRSSMLNKISWSTPERLHQGYGSGGGNSIVFALSANKCDTSKPHVSENTIAVRQMRSEQWKHIRSNSGRAVSHVNREITLMTKLHTRRRVTPAQYAREQRKCWHPKGSVAKWPANVGKEGENVSVKRPNIASASSKPACKVEGRTQQSITFNEKSIVNSVDSLALDRQSICQYPQMQPSPSTLGLGSTWGLESTLPWATVEGSSLRHIRKAKTPSAKHQYTNASSDQRTGKQFGQIRTPNTKSALPGFKTKSDACTDTFRQSSDLMVIGSFSPPPSTRRWYWR